MHRLLYRRDDFLFLGRVYRESPDARTGKRNAKVKNAKQTPHDANPNQFALRTPHLRTRLLLLLLPEGEETDTRDLDDYRELAKETIQRQETGRTDP